MRDGAAPAPLRRSSQDPAPFYNNNNLARLIRSDRLPISRLRFLFYPRGARVSSLAITVTIIINHGDLTLAARLEPVI